MKNQNGAPNKRNQLMWIAIIPVVIIVVMMYNNGIGAQSNVLITDVTKISQGQQLDPIGMEALEYYMGKVGEDVKAEDVEIVKKNFGCHYEYYIYNKGELVMKLSYSGGIFYEV